MSELNFEFEHEGRVVRPGQVLHVHPYYHSQAGAQAKVERFHGDGTVTLRAANSAIPTVPLTALSWNPHPETVAREAEAVAREELSGAGFSHPTHRDVAVWMAARRAKEEAAPPPAPRHPTP